MAQQREISFSYFVIAIDYGRRGLEAIVNPELTRRGAVELVRTALGDGHEIAFAHYVTMDDLPEDVKADLIDAARFDDSVEAIGSVLDHQAQAWDHARKLQIEARRLK